MLREGGGGRSDIKEEKGTPVYYKGSRALHCKNTSLSKVKDEVLDSSVIEKQTL